MIRMKHTQTGVRIVVTDDKAANLIANGTYFPVPDAEQLSKHESEELDRAATEAKAARHNESGRTSLSAAITDAAPENQFA